MKIIIENRTQLADLDALSLAMQMMEGGSDRRSGLARKFDCGVTVHAMENQIAKTFVVVYSEGK